MDVCIGGPKHLGGGGCRARCLGIGTCMTLLRPAHGLPLRTRVTMLNLVALGQTLWAQVGGPKHLETLTHDNKRKTKNIHSTVKGDFVEHCPTLIFFGFW